MSLINIGLFQSALQKCQNPQIWLDALNPALAKFEINSKSRIASFLAQTAYESGQFNNLIENLNYRASRLIAVWPKRFPTLAFAQQYEFNPEKLGNFVYANRIGNGNEASGDGFRYKGRGLIQLTGRSNYAAATTALSLQGLDLVVNPDDLIKPNIAALSAAWFWASHGLNALADDQTDDNDLEDFKSITLKINGGLAGLKDRFSLFKTIGAAL